jgi:hypothetical protein
VAHPAGETHIIGATSAGVGLPVAQVADTLSRIAVACPVDDQVPVVDAQNQAVDPSPEDLSLDADPSPTESRLKRNHIESQLKRNHIESRLKRSLRESQPESQQEADDQVVMEGEFRHEIYNLINNSVTLVLWMMLTNKYEYIQVRLFTALS